MNRERIGRRLDQVCASRLAFCIAVVVMVTVIGAAEFFIAALALGVLTNDIRPLHNHVEIAKELLQ